MSQPLVVSIGGVPVPSGFRLPSAVMPSAQAITAAMPAPVSSSDAFQSPRSPDGPVAVAATVVAARVGPPQIEPAGEQADRQIRPSSPR